MVKSNFFEILRTLKKSELKRLEVLIKSSYYNKNSNVTKLFMYVKKFYPDFNHKKLGKKEVWNALFNDKKFNYGIMKNLIYELNKHTEKFLELQEYENNEFESGLNLIKQLRQKNLNSRFEKSMKLFRDKISRNQISTKYYYYNFLIESIPPIYYSDYGKSKIYGNPKIYNMRLFSFFFQTFFYQNQCELMFNKTYNIGPNTKDLEAVMEFFEKNNFGKEPLTMLYYYALKLVLNPQEENLYYEAKSLFIKNLDKLDSKTKYNTAAMFINYWTLQSMNGNRKFDADQFEIIKLMLKNDFYMDNKLYLDPGLFAKIITVANYLGHTSWCKEFINGFHDKLDPAVKNNNYYFGMYIINKTENKLDESLKCLSKVKPTNVMEKITVKTFEIQVYYDLGYFADIYSLIKNCMEYLKHDKASSERSKMSLNDFLYSMKKLIDININPDSKKYDKHYFEELKKDITKRKFISKSWVLGKLQLLEKSAK